ncbi:unnamed protein product [Dibothriocephalus latus]|uniref:Uncharacterized protein n=1 Tax=Dibothriocephalus latus TaxID=60516 RepID=A0A3P7QD27_DIBLA|nr:unnamed protein product [Dibothriocephalus latus]
MVDIIEIDGRTITGDEKEEEEEEKKKKKKEKEKEGSRGERGGHVARNRRRRTTFSHCAKQQSAHPFAASPT